MGEKPTVLSAASRVPAGDNPRGERTGPLAAGLAVLAVAWFSEALVHAWVFHEGALLYELLPHGAHDWWSRATYSVAVLSLVGYVLLASARRARALAALRLRDRAISASSGGIVVTDPNLPDNPIIYVNPAFERMTGYSAEESIGRNCRFLQGEDRDQPALGELRAAIREGRGCGVTLRNYKKDGTPFLNELRVSPVPDGEGGVANFVGVQEDVTERKAHPPARTL